MYYFLNKIASYVRESPIFSSMAIIATIISGAVALLQFIGLEKSPFSFQDGKKPAELSTSYGTVKARPIADDHTGMSAQSCDIIAKQITDDNAQGYLLYAEKAQKSWSDMKCDRADRP